MSDEILKEVSRLDYFLRTLDTNNLIRKDYATCVNNIKKLLLECNIYKSKKYIAIINNYLNRTNFY